MRKFAINVNGKSYEVEVEELFVEGNVSRPTSVATPVASAPQPAPAPAPAPASNPAKAATPVAEGAELVKAPMPGSILDVKVQEGDTVTKGQVLAILEAMKMENEIMSPADGKISSVQVSKGGSVNSGDVMFAIQ